MCIRDSLLVTLAGFSLFSLKMPKGQLAMSGMANAAIATFLVEAVHKYITGDLLGLDFFRTVGSTSGSLGGVAAAIMVPISKMCIRDRTVAALAHRACYRPGQGIDILPLFQRHIRGDQRAASFFCFYYKNYI